jgi:hypothetical protein
MRLSERDCLGLSHIQLPQLKYAFLKFYMMELIIRLSSEENISHTIRAHLFTDGQVVINIDCDRMDNVSINIYT